MAEKPRLKKTDEILGSITAEPRRAAKKGSAGIPAEPEKERQNRNAKTPDVKITEPSDDFDDELESSDQQVVLPSAQSLAEKLFARDNKRRELNFEKYELPNRQKSPVQLKQEEPASIREAKKPAQSPKHEQPAPLPAGSTPAGVTPAAGRTGSPAEKPLPPDAARPQTLRPQPAPAKSAPPTANVVFEDASPVANVQFEFGEASSPAGIDVPDIKPRAGQSAPRHPRSARGVSASATPPVAETAGAVPAGVTPVPERSSIPVISEYSFTSFDDEPAPALTREFSLERDESAENRRSRERGRRSVQSETDNGQKSKRENESAYSEPEPEDIPPVEAVPRVIPPAEIIHDEPRPEQPRIILPQATQPETDNDPRPERKTPQAPPEKAAAEAPPARGTDNVSPEERDRRDFLNRISSQFELQFEEKFEQGTLRERGNVRWPETPEKSEPVRSHEDARPARTEPQPPEIADEQPDEDFFSSIQRPHGQHPQPVEDERPLRDMFEESGAASGFIAQFEQETREEERKRDEDFKETLAEKFDRERERYLRELEISQRGDEPPVRPDDIDGLFSPNPQQPQRRKLDFQIQPEMHTQSGGQTAPRPPASSTPAGVPPTGRGPVTYTRGGAARPQIPVTDDPADTRAFTAGGAPRKKTSEQLLMELGQRPRTAVPAKKAQTQKPLKFTFTTPEEQSQAVPEKNAKPVREPLLPKEKWPRRIVLIAAAAGLLSIALLVWPLVGYIRYSGAFTNPAETSSTDAAFTQDTLEVYEDRSFTQTAKLSNVLFKNSNVTLKNASVSDYIIVDGVSSAGNIRLEDVSVGAAISVKSAGISTLDLLNVRAERVIVNNPSSEMTVNLSGATDIGVFEIRTPTTVKQYDISGGASGVRSMTLTPPEGGSDVSAKLDGLALNDLYTAAQNSVLAFENGTRAETMSSDGSLSLSGSGRVVNLSVGAGIGQGAGETDDSKNISVLVKDVTVTNINVKSPANLNLATSVDNVTTSDPLNIGGAGSVGTLTLNQRLDGGRLSVDIAGLSIQNVYSNTQSRVSITGSARVNVLTADASVYVLGNKVNKLISNSDDVIYENKPDQVIFAEGVRPPQSVADNPHIDYNAGSRPGGLPPVGDSSTSCGHSTESGGFTAGNGSKDSLFEVSSPLQLAHVAAHPDSYFIQTGDIDIATESRFANGFSPVCSTGVPFAGQYNGAGYSIANLKISSSDEGTGLFGANKGLIQNVHIVSGEISSTAAAKSYVGAIAGENLEGGSIRSSSNSAVVSGNQYTYTGGIVGLNTGGKVHDCYNSGNVSGVDGVGGLVGVNDGSASITGSYNAGVVDGRDYTGSVTGSNSTGSTVANCYYLTDTFVYGIGGGSGTSIEKTPDELASVQMAADLAAGNESSLWVAGAPSGYRYPTHRKP